MRARLRKAEPVERAVDPMDLVQRIVDQALVLVPKGDGALLGVSDGSGTIAYVAGSGRLATFPGTRIAVQGSLSGLAISTGTVLRTDDTELDPRVDREASRRLGVRSSVCVPLRQPGGSPTGVLNVSSAEPRSFEDRDVAVLAHLADFVGSVMGAALSFRASIESLLSSPPGDGSSDIDRDQRERWGRFVAEVLNPGVRLDAEGRRRIERTIAEGEFGFAFQPMVHLGSNTVFGVEALARFRGEPVRGPDIWFSEAHAVGLGVQLETAAFKKALSTQPEVPPPLALSINVGADALSSRDVVEALGEAEPSRVILELTEHDRVVDYPALARSLADLRRAGVRLAVDDAGAGFASLAHILKLAPDFIKLDRELTSGIDVDPVRRCMASALVGFAKETGASIIAEGVETPDELATLRDLGVEFGQGYLLGRPAALHTLIPALR